MLIVGIYSSLAVCLVKMDYPDNDQLFSAVILLKISYHFFVPIFSFKLCI